MERQHHGCPGYSLLQQRPRGDDGMAQGHRVYFLGTRTSAVLTWWPSGPTPKPSAPRSAKVAVSSSRDAYSGGAGSRRGSPASLVRSLSSTSRCCPTSELTSRRKLGVGAPGEACNPWGSRSRLRPRPGQDVGHAAVPWSPAYGTRMRVQHQRTQSDGEHTARVRRGVLHRT
jgi:hypothetical protein